MDKDQIRRDLDYLDELALIAKTLEDKLYIKDKQRELLDMLKPKVVKEEDLDIECVGCGS